MVLTTACPCTIKHIIPFKSRINTDNLTPKNSRNHPESLSMEAISIRSFHLVVLHLQGKFLSKNPEKQTSFQNISEHVKYICAGAVKLTDLRWR